MKIQILAWTLLLCSPSVIAQINIRTAAETTFNEAISLQHSGDTENALLKFNEAGGLIDQAQMNPETQNDPKTLKYMGDIFLHTTGMHLESGNLDGAEESLMKSLDGYKRCLAVKSKNKYGTQVPNKLSELQDHSLKLGMQFYTQENWARATNLYRTTAELSEMRGFQDGLACYNVGLASEKNEDYETAYSYFKKCADMEYGGAEVYSSMSNSLLKLGRDSEAQEVIRTGCSKFQEDPKLIVQLVNIYLRNGDFDGAKGYLQMAIDQSPNNPNLHLALGIIYENLNDYNNAENSYQAAINLNPQFFDANFHLGNMLFNKGMDLDNNLDAKSKSEYGKAKAEIDGIFEKSLPYLETAHHLRSDDRNTMQSLLQLYSRMGDSGNYNVMKEKLNN